MVGATGLEPVTTLSTVEVSETVAPGIKVIACQSSKSASEYGEWIRTTDLQLFKLVLYL